MLLLDNPWKTASQKQLYAIEPFKCLAQKLIKEATVNMIDKVDFIFNFFLSTECLKSTTVSFFHSSLKLSTGKVLAIMYTLIGEESIW